MLIHISGYLKVSLFFCHFSTIHNLVIVCSLVMKQFGKSEEEEETQREFLSTSVIFWTVEEL